MKKKNLLKRLIVKIKNEYKKDKSIFILKVIGIILMLLFVFLPLILFWINFGINGLSDDFKNWVDFSTYISGTITPILAIINIIVLYQLTRTAKKIEQRNIASQLKKEEYVQLKRKVDIFTDKLLESKNKPSFDDKEELKKMRKIVLSNILNFATDYSFLFGDISNSSKYKSFIDKLKSITFDETNITYDEIIVERDNFFKFLQDQIFEQ